MLRTYPTCSYPGYQDTTTYAALLITMHKDGRCTAKPVVQVMSTVVTDGKLVSMTLSDGVYVSANIIPEDESLGQQLNQV